MSDYIDSELHYAAYFGDEATVRQCIKSGATVTWKGLWLHSITQDQGSLEVIRKTSTYLTYNLRGLELDRILCFN